MQLRSVNLGRPARLPGAPEKTGIVKEPVDGPIRITRDGLRGDAVCNRRYHGGPDQAVYVYGQPDYDWWSGLLGRTLEPGTFGENLTVGGLESARLNIGDRLAIGAAVLEVTAPRIPCGTLARRMGDPAFSTRFVEAERPGLYCRVIAEGEVRAGDTARVERRAGPTVSVVELFRDFYRPELTPEAIRRFLEAPIAARLREHKEKQMRRLSGS